MRILPQQKAALVAALLAVMGAFLHTLLAFQRGGVISWLTAGVFVLVALVWIAVYFRLLLHGVLQPLGVVIHLLLAFIVFYDKATGYQAALHQWMLEVSSHLYHLYLTHVAIYSILMAVYFLQPYFRADMSGKQNV